MRNAQNTSVDYKALVAMCIIVLVGLMGLSAYLSAGENIFWPLIQTGLAWCF